MKIKLLTGILILTSFSMGAQPNVRAFFDEIKQNNIQLKAYQDKKQAMKMANKTGIYPENPIVGGGYLWGSPADIGNRIDFGVSQSFDFPTAYKIRKQMAQLQDRDVEMEYLQSEFLLCSEAVSLIIDIQDNRRKWDLLNKRKEHFKLIADSYKSKLDKGDATIFDYDRAALNLLKIEKEIDHINIHYNSLRKKLNALNGNNELKNNPVNNKRDKLPDNFDDWFSQVSGRNPDILKSYSELEISKQNQKLVKAESLPSFEAGFMSENVEGEQFNGVTLGLSIPLWEDKNKKKLAIAQSKALSAELDAKTRILRNHFEIKFEEIAKKQESLLEFQRSLRSLDRRNLLAESLEAGQITLIEYFLELSNYYENEDFILQLERELDEDMLEIVLYSH